MKILLYAAYGDTSGMGGVLAYTSSLIKALGDLDSGNEEYLILGPSGSSAEWLKGLLGPNQTLIEHQPGRQKTLDQILGLGGRTIKRILNADLFAGCPQERLVKFLRKGPHAAGIHVSNGYYESLGASVFHFPSHHYVKTRLPSIFNPHDLQHLHFPEFFSREALIDRELKYYFACHHCDRLAVASSWVKGDLADKYQLSPDKIKVIPYGPATAALPAPIPETVTAVHQRYTQGAEYILYPAVAWAHKNHDRLLAAMARLRGSGPIPRLVLTGGGGELTESLRALVRKHDVADTVFVVGHVPKEDLRALYKAARAVIVPTLFEAASGPIVEAWLEGTPIACSDIPQLRDQAEGAALFFDPLDVTGIAQAYLRIARDEPLRQSLVSEGTRKSNALDWKNTALGYRDLYRETAGLARRRN